MRFIKIIDGKKQEPQKASESVIRGCFQFCTSTVKKRVSRFINEDRCKQLTVYFKDYKVKLVK